MPEIWPATSERILTPSSTAPVSASVRDGVAPALQTEHGHAGPAAVVNDQLTGATIVFPAVSFTPDTVAVYDVPAASTDDGVNVAVFVDELYAVVPVTEVAPVVSANPTVAAWTGSENVADAVADVATLVALFAGVVAVTVGGVVSGGATAAVVNDQVNGVVIVFPAVSFTPLTVAVYVVLASLGVATPLVVTLVLGDRSTSILEGWHHWLEQYNEVVMAVLYLVFAFVLIGNGIQKW